MLHVLAQLVCANLIGRCKFSIKTLQQPRVSIKSEPTDTPAGCRRGDHCLRCLPRRPGVVPSHPALLLYAHAWVVKPAAFFQYVVY